MELKFELSKEQLDELAKMLYIAQYFFDSSGPFSKGYQYPLLDVFQSTLREMNKQLLLANPEIDLLELDANSDNVFTHSLKMETACEEVKNTFHEESILEIVATALTNKECEELYPQQDITFEIKDIIFDRNLKWLQENGIENLRME